MTKGPVETLCLEVDYPFFKKLESTEFLRKIAIHYISELYEHERNRVIADPSLRSVLIEFKEASSCIAGFDQLDNFDAFYEYMYSKYGGENKTTEKYQHHLLYLSYALKISIDRPQNSRHMASAIRDLGVYIYEFKKIDHRTARFSKQFAWDLVHKTVESLCK